MRRRVRQISAPRSLLAATSPRLREERGAAMVEFALIASVLLLVVIGIVYFGRFLNYTTQETHLATEAARWAAVGQVPSNCTTTLAACIRSQASTELQTGSTDVSRVSVCVANGVGGSGMVGDPVTVTVKSTFKFLPFLKIVSIPETQTATMRLEAPTSSATVPIVSCAS
jgi:Flp pilus assembly protein TadG